MTKIVENYNTINSNIRKLNPKNPVKIIAISKTFDLNHIKPLIDIGHEHFGENKVQEAVTKWSEIKKEKNILNFIWSENCKVIKLKMLFYYLIIFTL